LQYFVTKLHSFVPNVMRSHASEYVVKYQCHGFGFHSGYKAFCSSECRSKEIDLDEEMEDGDEEEAIKSVSSSDKESKKKSNGVFFTVG